MIAGVHGQGNENGVSRFAMEVHEGSARRASMDQVGTAVDGRLSDVLDLIARPGAPLAHPRASGIGDGDLKPENVLVTPDGSRLLVEFGLLSPSGSATGREVLALG